MTSTRRNCISAYWSRRRRAVLLAELGLSLRPKRCPLAPHSSVVCLLPASEDICFRASCLVPRVFAGAGWGGGEVGKERLAPQASYHRARRSAIRMAPLFQEQVVCRASIYLAEQGSMDKTSQARQGPFAHEDTLAGGARLERYACC